MKRAVLIILIGLSLCPYYYSQQKTFGSKISGNGDIISDVFLVHDGFVLDSVNADHQVYRFEYYPNGKLSRDINIVINRISMNINGQTKYITVPGYRDYYYNSKGLVDSMLTRYWNDTLSVWVDNLSFVTYYFYNDDEQLLSKSYSNSASVDEYNYDSNGNLIAANRIGSGDTISTVREYDSQNRLLSIKEITNGVERGDQYIYQYDSTGNVNCLYRKVYTDRISNKNEYYFEFDESGKLIHEIDYSDFRVDSTWGDNNEIFLTYDENDRILENGPYYWFHYNTDGNLDSMVNTHYRGYLFDKGTFVDSYGNNLSFRTWARECHMYYSGILAGFNDPEYENMAFTLRQNYPNPFNPVTKITFSLPEAGFVTLKIYDILGREIATLLNEVKASGTYEKEFNASQLPSGTYIYRLSSGTQHLTRKMLLIK